MAHQRAGHRSRSSWARNARRRAAWLARLAGGTGLAGGSAARAAIGEVLGGPEERAVLNRRGALLPGVDRQAALQPGAWTPRGFAPVSCGGYPAPEGDAVFDHLQAAAVGAAPLHPGERDHLLFPVVGAAPHHWLLDVGDVAHESGSGRLVEPRVKPQHWLLDVQAGTRESGSDRLAEPEPSKPHSLLAVQVVTRESGPSRLAEPEPAPRHHLLSGLAVTRASGSSHLAESVLASRGSGSYHSGTEGADLVGAAGSAGPATRAVDSDSPGTEVMTYVDGGADAGAGIGTVYGDSGVADGATDTHAHAPAEGRGDDLFDLARDSFAALLCCLDACEESAGGFDAWASLVRVRRTVEQQLRHLGQRPAGAGRCGIEHPDHVEAVARIGGQGVVDVDGAV